jgi:hypothetical protein
LNRHRLAPSAKAHNAKIILLFNIDQQKYLMQLAKMTNKFKVRINDGDEQDIVVQTGLYVSAAAAVPALLGIDADAYPVKVTIWAEHLVPEYGPYDYHIEKAGDAACLLVKRWDGELLALRP